MEMLLAEVLASLASAKHSVLNGAQQSQIAPLLETED